MTTHLHLVPRSKNAWSYTSTSQYVFIISCLIKSGMRLHGVVLSLAHRDNFTLFGGLHSNLLIKFNFSFRLELKPSLHGHWNLSLCQKEEISLRSTTCTWNPVSIVRRRNSLNTKKSNFWLCRWYEKLAMGLAIEIHLFFWCWRKYIIGFANLSKFIEKMLRINMILYTYTVCIQDF